MWLTDKEYDVGKLRINIIQTFEVLAYLPAYVWYKVDQWIYFSHIWMIKISDEKNDEFWEKSF